MTRFVLNLVLFFGLTSFILLCFVLINSMLVKEHSKMFQEHIKYLVLGDSNPKCAVDVTTDSSFTNYAGSGDSYFYTYLKLKMLATKTKKIDTLILSISPHNLHKNIETEWLFNTKHMRGHFPIYYQYFSAEEWSLFMKNNPLGSIKAMGKIIDRAIRNVFKYYVFNKDLGYTWGEGHKKLKPRKAPFYDILQDFELESNLKSDCSNKAINEIHYFHKTIDIAKQNDIPIILLSTPKRHELWDSEFYCTDLYASFCKENILDLTLVELHDFPISDSGYYDLMHLSGSGAKTFTKELSFILQSKSPEPTE